MRELELDDLRRLQNIAEPRFSPDGRYVLYSLASDDTDADYANTDLWRVDRDGGGARALTRTPHRAERMARWSPDGKQIAFLAADEENAGIEQLYLMPSKGGRARALTRMPGGVAEFAWAPDGQRIALIAEDARPEGEKDSRGKRRPRPPIEIDRFLFKWDYRGYLEGQYLRLHVLDVKSGQTMLIAPGDFDNFLPSWSPDGRYIAFVSRRGEDADRSLDWDVFIVEPRSGAEPRRISAVNLLDSDPYWESPPAWSPDSRRLAWLCAREPKWVYYAPGELCVADVATGAVNRPANVDRQLYKPRWSADGTHLLALVEQDRSTWLARVDIGKDEISYLREGPRFGFDFDVASDGAVALLESTDTQPYAISVLATNGAEQVVARHNEWLDGIRLRETTEFTHASADGTEIHSLLMLPEQGITQPRFPLIVRVHGGPTSQFSHEFWFDWQLYAARGFAVLAVNPRGSTGRGFDFARAIYADWGDLDARDILAGIDELEKRGIVDPKRIGTGGWSYGGILANALIARDQRFAAAVSGAGSANAFAYFGTDQYSAEMINELGPPWENFATYLRNSWVYLNAGRIRTPTLFQCAELDFNVPCMHSEQMYQALRTLRVPTRLVIYPGQYHSLDVPSYLHHRLRQSLEWYERYLAPPTNADGSDPP